MEHALPADLPLPLLERLRAEGIATLEAWVALGRIMLTTHLLDACA